MSAIVVILLIAFIVVLVVGGGLALWGIGVYNGLVRGREAVNNAWAQIDVLLKRRHDLIPNLVETVKGYASHESETFEKVIQARNGAVAATGPQQSSAAEGMLTGALRQLFAVAEAYPDLKANQNFMQLQAELSTTEDEIAGVRSRYNDVAKGYNISVKEFPRNLLAGIFGFNEEPYFEVEDAEVQAAPKVQF
ncbi:MAG: LemA family protein [Planctomycetota bacterium]